jgi:hypothetical protein
MTRKRRAKRKRRETTAPRRGAAEAGVPVRPTDLPEEESAKPARDRPRAAPPPGVPMSTEEYERLKREARTAPMPDEAPAQEDRPPGKEDA